MLFLFISGGTENQAAPLLPTLHSVMFLVPSGDIVNLKCILMSLI